MQIQEIQEEIDSNRLSTQPNAEAFIPQKKVVKQMSQPQKMIIILLFYIIGFAGNSQYMVWKITNLIIYLLLFVICRHNRFDLIIILLGVILGVISVFQQQFRFVWSQCLISLTLLTLDSSQRLIKESQLVWQAIKNLVVTMFFVILFCAYIGTDYYKGDENVIIYFGNYALSLDDWGYIGLQTDDLFGCIYFCLFILLMTYFYMNIMMGQLIETLANEQKLIKNSDQLTYEENQDQLFNDITRLDTLDDYLIGYKYQMIVFIMCFGSVTLTVWNDFETSGSTLVRLLGMADDIIYTIHLIVIVFLSFSKTIYRLERKSYGLMLLHILAGPVSLITSYYVDIGCALNMLKIPTTPSVKGIFKGTVNLLPMLLPQFVQLMGIVMWVSSILTCHYYLLVGQRDQEYFISFWSSSYSLIQIMTLDDWSAVVEPIYETYSSYSALMIYMLIPAYIVISNFIVLNTLIAISCEYFVEIKFVKIMKRQPTATRQQIVSMNEFEKYCKSQQSKNKFLTFFLLIVMLRIPHVQINSNDRLYQMLKQREFAQILISGKKSIIFILPQSDAL